MYAWDSSLLFQSSTFSDNVANSGGASHLSGPRTVLNSSGVCYERNVAAGEGGALSVKNASAVVVLRSMFAENIATSAGAVFADSARSLVLDGVNATGNRRAVSPSDAHPWLALLYAPRREPTILLPHYFLPTAERWFKGACSCWRISPTSSCGAPHLSKTAPGPAASLFLRMPR